MKDRIQHSLRLNPSHVVIYKFQIYEYMYEWLNIDSALNASS